MKITRLAKIKQHRIFEDFTWPAGLPDFVRFNLIYGWNGTGKTTLSNLFHHLQSKQTVTEGEVQFRIDDRLVNHSELSDAVLPQVRVFNRDTVKRSIFEIAHEKLPPVYYLGEDSAEKQAKITQLKLDHAAISAAKGAAMQAKVRAERDFETFCTDQARAIKNLLTATGSTYNTYNAARFKQRAEALKGQQPVARLADEEIERYLSTKASSVKDPIPVPQAMYPDFVALTQRVNDLLGRSVVATTIDALANDPPLSAWVRTGLDLHRGTQPNTHCRFCEQTIPDGRLERLEAHFNEAFNQFQAEIAALTDEVAAAKRFVAELAVPDKGLLYEHLSNDYEEARNRLRQQSFSVAHFLDAVGKALGTKASQPFQHLNLPTFLAGGDANSEETAGLLKLLEVFVAAGSAFGTYVGKHSFERLCQLIEEHNRHSANFGAVQHAARAALETDEVAKGLENYLVQRNEIAKLEAEIAQATGTLQRMQKGIDQLNAEIREHFKAADELTRDMASYLGRDELKFTAHEGGYSITRGGQPALHLSEGERTAVSFIYFLKSLEDTGFDLKSGVVVVDDPVSSLDANSLYSAFGFMRSRLKHAGQLFVLTHNFTFFRQVNNWLTHRQKTADQQENPRDAQQYMLRSKSADGRRTVDLCLLDPLLQNYQSEYHFLFKSVLNAAREDSASMAEFYSMPNVARRLLEGVMSFKRPDKTGKLQQQIDGIQGFDEAKKARVIRFTHSYSHHGMVAEPEHDLSILAEGPEILRDVLKIIEHVDKEHYDKMVRVCL